MTRLQKQKKEQDKQNEIIRKKIEEEIQSFIFGKMYVF